MHGARPLMPGAAKVDTVNSGVRLQMLPEQRLAVALLIAGSVGFFRGIIQGSRLAAMRYLAENAHRLPRNVGSWYFFHKRKNYVTLKDGVNTGAVWAFKYCAVTGFFIVTEAAIDRVRQRVDFLATTGSATLSGLTVALYKKLELKQAIRSAAGFMMFGLVVGIAEDALRFLRHKFVPVSLESDLPTESESN